MVAARRAFPERGATTASSGRRWENSASSTVSRKPESRSICWTQAAARAGMTGASPGSSKRRASRWNWPVLTSQSLPCVWLRRLCPRPVRRGVQFPSAGAHRLGGCAAQLLLAPRAGGVSPRPAPRRTAHLRRAGCRASLLDEGRPLRKALQEPGAGSGVSGL